MRAQLRNGGGDALDRPADRCAVYAAGGQARLRSQGAKLASLHQLTAAGISLAARVAASRAVACSAMLVDFVTGYKHLRTHIACTILHQLLSRLLQRLTP